MNLSWRLKGLANFSTSKNLFQLYDLNMNPCTRTQSMLTEPGFDLNHKKIMLKKLI
jgi:hypothetical protein